MVDLAVPARAVTYPPPGIWDAVWSPSGAALAVEIRGRLGAAEVIAVLGQPGRLFFHPVECTIRAYSGARPAPAASAEALSPPAGRGTRPVGSSISGACGLSPARQGAYLPPHGDRHGDTPEAYDTEDAPVVLSYPTGYQHGRYVLGPVEMTGSIVKEAAAVLVSQTDQWEVDLTFTAAGSSKFNYYAARHYACYARRPHDPPDCALEAVDLDGTLESAPVVKAATYDGAAVTNGPIKPFTRQQARTIAALVGSGALPVAFSAAVIDSVTPSPAALGAR
ncbi:MAG: SecDF P1 head subdomain-containing protein [Acidimicrobiales bacterium]